MLRSDGLLARTLVGTTDRKEAPWELGPTLESSFPHSGLLKLSSSASWPRRVAIARSPQRRDRSIPYSYSFSGVASCLWWGLGPGGKGCFVLLTSADSLIKPSLRWGHEGQAFFHRAAQAHSLAAITRALLMSRHGPCDRDIYTWEADALGCRSNCLPLPNLQRPRS